MPRIRVRAQQVVKYDQILTLTDEELAEFRAEANSGVRRRQKRAWDGLAAGIDVRDVDDAEEIDSEEMEASVVDADGKFIEQI